MTAIATFPSRSVPVPHIQLTAHVVEPNPVGIRITAPTADYVLGDGTTINLPVPFMPAAGPLVITPEIALDGEAGLRLDFTRWSPMRLGADGGRFPFTFTGQALAIRIGRAYDADPTTTWRYDVPAAARWLRRHAAEFGVRF